MPILNITIPVFNRPELTRRTIEAVRKNTKHPYTLTAVDNGSEAETQDLLREMKERGQLDYLFRLEKNYGVAVAANVGWRLIQAPIYMKLDNDVVIHNPKWLDIVLLHMKKAPRDAVWGADLNHQLQNKCHVPKRDGLIGRAAAHVSGGAILIPRTISDIVGYWCEDYGLYGCEDGDYGEKLKSLNIDQYYFDHTPFMEHLGHDSESVKKDFGLNKKVTQDLFRKLYTTNYFLYAQGHRAANTPPQLIPAAFDGYTLAMTSNAHYRPIWHCLLEFHNHRTNHPDDTALNVETLHKLITLQNDLWAKAEADAEQAYSRIRQQIGQPA
ncbi:glycosyltransferase [Desulfovibrio mangrovi]|uniref:glycosyltransferase n=1 Tax=Desulfovibrio mangrovi TaxID=2976983 RepID=UPI00224818F4|nr:glycosyltransferase [Desulfovibrio mangrovi]UZP69112.1 glycosyltransferase [Desulfovibrio mangrovi]